MRTEIINQIKIINETPTDVEAESKIDMNSKYLASRSDFSTKILLLLEDTYESYARTEFAHSLYKLLATKEKLTNRDIKTLMRRANKYASFFENEYGQPNYFDFENQLYKTKRSSIYFIVDKQFLICRVKANTGNMSLMFTGSNWYYNESTLSEWAEWCDSNGYTMTNKPIIEMDSEIYWDIAKDFNYFFYYRNERNITCVEK